MIENMRSSGNSNSSHDVFYISSSSSSSSPAPLLQASAMQTLEELKYANVGSHYLIVYPDMVTLREVYSNYTKAALYERNEIIIILPFFETVDTVRQILAENSTKIDVRKYEKEGSLVIIDSLRGYFENPAGVMSFIKGALEYAKFSGKSGVSVFGDSGSFFHYHNKHSDLVEYELSLPSEYGDMNLKTFCLYHKKNFDMRLTEEQKQKLLEHHGKDIIIKPCSSYPSLKMYK